jgi:hypothetical protein
MAYAYPRKRVAYGLQGVAVKLVWYITSNQHLGRSSNQEDLPKHRGGSISSQTAIIANRYILKTYASR